MTSEEYIKTAVKHFITSTFSNYGGEEGQVAAELVIGLMTNGSEETITEALKHEKNTDFLKSAVGHYIQSASEKNLDGEIGDLVAKFASDSMENGFEATVIDVLDDDGNDDFIKEAVKSYVVDAFIGSNDQLGGIAKEFINDAMTNGVQAALEKALVEEKNLEFITTAFSSYIETAGKTYGGETGEIAAKLVTDAMENGVEATLKNAFNDPKNQQFMKNTIEKYAVEAATNYGGEIGGEAAKLVNNVMTNGIEPTLEDVNFDNEFVKSASKSALIAAGTSVGGDVGGAMGKLAGDAMDKGAVTAIKDTLNDTDSRQLMKAVAKGTLITAGTALGGPLGGMAAGVAADALAKGVEGYVDGKSTNEIMKDVSREAITSTGKAAGTALGGPIGEAAAGIATDALVKGVDGYIDGKSRDEIMQDASKEALISAGKGEGGQTGGNMAELTANFAMAQIEPGNSNILKNGDVISLKACAKNHANPCGKDTSLKEAYRCHTCKKLNNMCVCTECFEAADHNGHNFERIERCGNRSCCDCGEDKSMHSFGFCKSHEMKGGMYVSVGSDGLLSASKSNNDDSTRFTVHTISENRVALQSKANGKFITADNYGNSPLTANRDKVDGWEHFDVIDVSGSIVALRSKANDKFVCSEYNGESLIANRDAHSEWEHFEIVY